MRFERVRRLAAVRHPGPVLALWAARCLGAWVVAGPVAAVLTAGLEHQPRTDAVLFDPGGAYLLETIRLHRDALAINAQHAVWAALTVGALCLLPLTALVVALARRGGRPDESWLHRTAHHVPGFALLAGLTVLAQVAVGSLVAVVALGARQSLALHLGQRCGDSSLLGLGGLAVTLIVFIGVVQDLARAASVRHDCGVVDSIRTATGVALAHPGQIGIAWLTPAIWSTVLVLAAMMVTRSCRLDAPGDWRWAVLIGVHQLAALGMAALRATWLARAVAFVASESWT